MSSKLDEAFPEHPIDNVPDHARTATAINGADLRAELYRVPSDLAYYGFQYARATRRLLAAKARLEEVRAGAYLDIRERLTDLGEKVTEGIIEARVVTQSPVREARAELIEAEFEREQMRAMADAVRAKRESLMTLGLLAKAELAGTSGFREPAAE